MDDAERRQLDLLEAEISDVERVLTRLDDGTYGTCEACGARLAEARLVESPAARWCDAHLPLTEAG